MLSIWSFLMFVHLVGLSLGVGAATVKLTLLFRTKRHPDFIPTYLMVTKPITRIIIIGLILLTLSGVAWIALGTTFTSLFILKLILVLVVWVLGPVIDNVVERKYKRFAPVPGNQASTEFPWIEKKLLALEMIATFDFYVIAFLGVLI